MKKFIYLTKFFIKTSREYLGKPKFKKSKIGNHKLFDGYKSYTLKEKLSFPITYIKFMYYSYKK